MVDVFLGLGANEGDREMNIAMAIEHLKNIVGVRIEAVSSLYETVALAESDQPDYINCAIRIGTALDPHSLLKAAQGLEKRLGRQPRSHMLPRPIDIDILLYDDAVIDSAELKIPHPRLKQRRFVLEPLLEIAPDTIDPVTSKPLREFLDATKSQIVNKIKDSSEVWHA